MGDGSGLGQFGAFGVFFVIVAVFIAVMFVSVAYRLVRDRKKIAAYRNAMYELPGAILQATQEGDLAKAQLLQQQLVLMQQQQMLGRRGAGTFGSMPPNFPGTPGDTNGDGIPG